MISLNTSILRILRKATTSPESILFGATGDIDNLGMFVALNGRAKAENLVDVYNHIIGSTIDSWITEHSTAIIDYIFVPSGEECFLLGISNNTECIDAIFDTLTNNINKIIHQNSFIDITGTSISFGCSVLPHTVLPTDPNSFSTSDIFNHDTHEAYFSSLETIRNILAVRLDAVKFRLGAERQGTTIMFRNLVYHFQYQNKLRTHEAIDLLRCSEMLGLSEFFSLSDSYGLSNGIMELMSTLVKSLQESRKDG